jgi:hypothetical protein
MAMTGKSRIMIYGPKDDGTYTVEFRRAAGEALTFRSPGLLSPDSLLLFQRQQLESCAQTVSRSSERRRQIAGAGRE